MVYFWGSSGGLGVTKVHGKGDRTQLRESYYLKPLRLQKQDCNIIINSTNSFQMIKEEQNEPQSLESNQSVEFEYLTNKTYEELLQSHDLAKQFIEELGDLRTTPVSECLVAYSKEMGFSFKSCDLVMELMESRLNKMIKNNKLKKNWSEEDLQILVWLLSKYMQKNSICSHELMDKEDWTRLSAMIPGSTPKGCMFKFVSLKKFKLAHHKWQKDEENLLFRIITQIGTHNWKTISERLYEENTRKKIYRTAKQCREHWSCYLDPRIKKGPWDKEEDKKLLQIVLESNCQKKWSVIKHQFEGRTQNALKNRYNLLLQKQKEKKQKQTPPQKQEELILKILKEDKEETNEQVKKIQKEQPKSVIAVPQPIYPVVPQERRSVNMQYGSGYIILFNGVNAQNNLSSWFYQM